MKRKIVLESKKKNPRGLCMVSLTKEAYEVLERLQSETGDSFRKLASTIITQAYEKDLIAFDMEVEDEQNS